jgi:hypothetical protein
MNPCVFIVLAFEGPSRVWRNSDRLVGPLGCLNRAQLMWSSTRLYHPMQLQLSRKLVLFINCRLYCKPYGILNESGLHVYLEYVVLRSCAEHCTEKTHNNMDVNIPTFLDLLDLNLYVRTKSMRDVCDSWFLCYASHDSTVRWQQSEPNENRDWLTDWLTDGSTTRCLALKRKSELI